MIRFIDINEQISSGTKEFAFYCTVTESFKKFNGNQTWESKEEFMLDTNGQINDQARYLRLIPEDWNERNKLHKTFKFRG